MPVIEHFLDRPVQGVALPSLGQHLPRVVYPGPEVPDHPGHVLFLEQAWIGSQQIDEVFRVHLVFGLRCSWSPAQVEGEPA